ncbi:MAG TPA: hypothetical protein VIS56_01565 [Candidatus Saccharimonadales bacterium]
MKKILLISAAVFAAAASLVLWGSTFAASMVHDQLVAQKISFPDADKLREENPALLKYAGQMVDNGAKAKAYSDYIAGHLKNVANGKTYSEVSGEYQKDRTNQTLASQRQTLFMGETLRGLLLNAWGWGLIGTLALYAAIAMYAVAVGLGVVAVTTPAKKRVKK